MDTKTFLSRVSAAADNLLICTLKPDPSGDRAKDIFWNRGSYTDLDAATSDILRWNNQADWTVYFAVGRMAGHEYTKPTGKIGYRRQQQNATMFKAICLDMDIGGMYQTKKDGHRALMSAVRSIGMPDPMVIDSGGGIHYYWPLTEAIEQKHWVKASTALRIALAEHNVEIDTTKIHDPSMVLRPVGTHNKKQVPWREVTCLSDCPDYDAITIIKPLQPWFSKVPAAAKAKRPVSSMMGAVLITRNVVLDVLGRKCAQVAALLKSGGEFDGMGRFVEEPLWRIATGLANFCTDPEEALLRLGGAHPTYDHDENLKKMALWQGGPPTCETFKQICPGGCSGCSYNVKSPVSLNEEPVAIAPPQAASQAAQSAAPAASAFVAPAPSKTPVLTCNMPFQYMIDQGKIWTEEEEEYTDKDPTTGAKTQKTRINRHLVSPYVIHVLAIFSDLECSSATVKIAVQYPIVGWKEHEMPMGVAFSGGTEFTNYLADKQIIVTGPAVTNRLRTYLMRYLEQVQKAVPAGTDFKRFGWQDDGSFLCGTQLIGSPTGNTLRRLRGGAAAFGDILKAKGDRDAWADMTKLADAPGGEFLGVALLSGCMGVLGNSSGTGTLLFSFYSHNTGTGKTLSLLAGNSVAGNPVPMLRNAKDTDNALYKVFGTFGDISCSIDEITSVSPERAVELAYNTSQGTEKLSLTKDRDIRAAEIWGAPARVSTNTSTYYLFSHSMAQNDPVRYRTLEFDLNDRAFVEQHGATLYRTLTTNYGFALPELAQQVIDAGGRHELWEKGCAAFDKKFGFVFESQERYYKSACVTCWIVGKLGIKAGLFRFDLDKVIQYMLNRVASLRVSAAASSSDAFDIIGQFVQEHNDKLIVTKEVFGSRKVEVQPPVPDNAVVRLEVVHDSYSPVLPGSKLIINIGVFKQWLKKSKDNLERITQEIDEMGALLLAKDRYSLYRGCYRINPGQAYCIILDASHHRVASVISGGKPVKVNPTAPAQALLVGATS